MTHVICTGNIGNNDTFKLLKDLSENYEMVLGDCDKVLPSQLVL